MSKNKIIGTVLVTGILAALLGFAGGMQFTSTRDEAGLDANIAGNALLRANMLKASAAWQSRAETCEAKFTAFTVIYEPEPAVSLPLLNGVAAVTLGSGERMVPVFWVPSKVAPNSPIPGAQYRWFSMKTGEALGTFPTSAVALLQGAQVQ